MNVRDEDFAELGQTVAFMAGFVRPWFVAGGWAIDLYLGRRSREHEDVDIAIFRPDQLAMQDYLVGWHLQKVRERMLEEWRPGEWLALPIHEIHIHRDIGDPNKLEILLDERDDDLWRYRKNVQITRPVEKMAMRTASGIPHLAPEVALLYKASSRFSSSPQPIAAQEKDQGDFDRAIPHLDAERAGWLKRAIEVCYPGHPWLSKL